VDHVDERGGNTLLMEALGTADLDFLDGLLGQLVNAGSKACDVEEPVRWTKNKREGTPKLAT
jgi:hypothetical protein